MAALLIPFDFSFCCSNTTKTVLVVLFVIMVSQTSPSERSASTMSKTICIFTECDVRKFIEGFWLNYYRRWRKRRRIFLVVFDFGLTIPWTIPLASCSIFGRKAGWAAPSLGKIRGHLCERRGHQGQAPENQGIDSPKSKGNAHF